MPLGSFAHDALFDLGPDDLKRMLALDETLFVEHKTSVGRDTAHGVVKGVASFANTAGGWLLLGVTDGAPNGRAAEWHEEGKPVLVDVVRDRLRGELDPLPAFEAKVLYLGPDKSDPVGVVRVYESADTPHVAIRTGAVYVRETAGVADAANAGQPQGGKRGERIYRATEIRSREQLVELSERGRRAERRVGALLDPGARLPLVAGALPMHLEETLQGYQPDPFKEPVIVARVAPLTIAPRFRGWATTADAAAAVLKAVEPLAMKQGLRNDWVEPDPSGVAVRVPLDPGARHVDRIGLGLNAAASVVLDGAGIGGAAISLEGSGEERRRWVNPERLAKELIRPVIMAAAEVLAAGEFLGRARCQVDLVGIGRAMLVEDARDGVGRPWIPLTSDLSLPADVSQIDAVAQRAANAYVRSGGGAAWDP